MEKRILLITSFFSGIKASIMENKWQPTGMPSIYKLMEELKNNGISFDYIFINSNSVNSTIEKQNDFLPKSKLYILNKKKLLLPNPLKDYINSRLIFKRINTLVDLNSYDAIYIDRANVIVSPHIRRHFNGMLILRLHGIGNLYTEFQNAWKRLKHLYKIYSYSSEFDIVICTLDGTPVRQFLSSFIINCAQKKVMLSGFDFKNNSSANYNSSYDKVKFLFLNRLEEDKGVVEFIKFCNLAKDFRDQIQINIVGDGIFKKEIEMLVDNSSDFINYYGTVSHSEVENFYKETDFYISLNKLGNISNTVIEAIMYNNIIITFKSDDKLFKDIDTSEFLGDAAIYIDRGNIVNELYDITQRIVDKKLNKSILLQNSYIIKNKIHTWSQRINEEINLIFKER